jgi:hypothetical protein
VSSSGGQLSPGQLGRLPAGVRDAVQEGASQGLHLVMIGASVITASCLLIGWFLHGRIETGATPPSSS